ncbi:MAG: aminomethyl-transferring glycine dehydrogenase, partial [bacterium]|nr:aminomethyl-transferring glycine dehydrogenase [Candidatus Kapabacteria bacterium]
GSTITQQLVRSVHDEAIGNEVSIQRKWREGLAAVALERQFSKHDILTMYLNQIFYGNRSYGIEAAAQTYFHKSAADLTGLPIANASLLDEGTAAAEAMHMSAGIKAKGGANAFFISQDCLPQTIEVVRTRAIPLGIDIVVGDHRTFDFSTPVFGVLLQYPAADGAVYDYREFIESAHSHDAVVTVAADLLSLALLEAPGEIGADIVVGTTQRFGVPMGYGGPHAGFFATRDDYKRSIPGRIIGVSVDAQGRPALRMALQTREQHIRREKATSNICTAQVLLAVIAGMYAVYHGPKGIHGIASRVHAMSLILAAGVRRLGFTVAHDQFFDTIRVELGGKSADAIMNAAREKGINLRQIGSDAICVAFDETVRTPDVAEVLAAFNGGSDAGISINELADSIDAAYPQSFARTTPYLTHPVFNRYHSETEMLRYMRKLESRDLSLTHSMIPLGSCTMKLNASSEMYPVTWPEIGRIHPFAPREQTQGYTQMFEQLEAALAEITGFARVSQQPNAGAQGEYAGLLVIREHLNATGQGHRNICLIPQSAHGTNPASAVMAGMKVVVTATDANGNIDLADLKRHADEHSEDLAALMVTYPSTHGVFEESIREVCEIIHSHGGQVYMDGANMNA